MCIFAHITLGTIFWSFLACGNTNIWKSALRYAVYSFEFLDCTRFEESWWTNLEISVILNVIHLFLFLFNLSTPFQLQIIQIISNRILWVVNCYESGRKLLHPWQLHNFVGGTGGNPENLQRSRLVGQDWKCELPSTEAGMLTRNLGTNLWWIIYV
jgi:hypothetical protein